MVNIDEMPINHKTLFYKAKTFLLPSQIPRKAKSFTHMSICQTSRKYLSILNYFLPYKTNISNLCTYI